MVRIVLCHVNFTRKIKLGTFQESRIGHVTFTELRGFHWPSNSYLHLRKPNGGRVSGLRQPGPSLHLCLRGLLLEFKYEPCVVCLPVSTFTQVLTHHCLTQCPEKQLQLNYWALESAEGGKSSFQASSEPLCLLGMAGWGGGWSFSFAVWLHISLLCPALLFTPTTAPDGQVEKTRSPAQTGTSNFTFRFLYYIT